MFCTNRCNLVQGIFNRTLPSSTQKQIRLVVNAAMDSPPPRHPDKIRRKRFKGSKLSEAFLTMWRILLNAVMMTVIVFRCKARGSEVRVHSIECYFPHRCECDGSTDLVEVNKAHK